MIELMKNLPSDTVGLRAEGEVTANDYTTTVIPAIEKAEASHDKINLVYVLGKGLKHFDVGAAAKDAGIGLHTKPRQWGRVALVTDHDWITKALGVVAALYPMNLHHFSDDQEAAAIAWATGESSETGEAISADKS